MKRLLPLTFGQITTHGYWEIRDVNYLLVGTHLTQERAEFLVTAANAHYGLVEELAKRMYSAAAISKATRTASKLPPSWRKLGTSEKQVWHEKAIAQAKL